MSTNTTLTVFKYKPENFKTAVPNVMNSESEFDLLLNEKWRTALNNNVFRYKINIKGWKVIEGQYQFFAQLNLDRSVKRRKGQSITSIKQPFDSSKFNFNQLPDKEILFDIEDQTGNNIIAINDSPLEWGHCLFVPERLKSLPQVLTKYGIRKAIELLLTSSSPNLRIIYNSLCGNATVNHLHWHLYYLKHRLLLESIKLNPFVGQVNTLEDFPSKGFCVRLSSGTENDLYKCVEITYSVVKYMQEKEIAHNVYITRGMCNSDLNTFDEIRIYIWARKPNYGVSTSNALDVGSCQLFGHFIIPTEEEYNTLTENDIVEVLHNLTHDVFSSVKNDVHIMLSEMCS